MHAWWWPIILEQALQFLGALRGEGQVESDVSSAYKVQQVIDAAYDSAAQNGAPITIGVA